MCGNWMQPLSVYIKFSLSNILNINIMFYIMVAPLNPTSTLYSFGPKAHSY